jgi:hypothetical protein
MTTVPKAPLIPQKIIEIPRHLVEYPLQLRSPFPQIQRVGSSPVYFVAQVPFEFDITVPPHTRKQLDFHFNGFHAQILELRHCERATPDIQLFTDHGFLAMNYSDNYCQDTITPIYDSALIPDGCTVHLVSDNAIHWRCEDYIQMHPMLLVNLYSSNKADRLKFYPHLGSILQNHVIATPTLTNECQGELKIPEIDGAIPILSGIWLDRMDTFNYIGVDFHLPGGTRFTTEIDRGFKNLRTFHDRFIPCFAPLERTLPFSISNPMNIKYLFIRLQIEYLDVTGQELQYNDFVS